MSIDLEEIIRKNHNFREIIEIDKFTTWFNTHCATVIDHDGTFFRAFLVVYEQAYKEVKEELVVKEICNYWTIDESQKRTRETKEDLIKGDIRFLDYSNLPIREINFSPTENPDNYIRPLDIVKRKIIIPDSTNNQQIYHVAIYLGKGKVCHIYNPNSKEQNDVKSDLWINALRYLFGYFFEIDISNQISGYHFASNSLGVGDIKNENFWVITDDWEKFLCKTTDNVICYHPVTLPKKKRNNYPKPQKILRRRIL